MTIDIKQKPNSTANLSDLKLMIEKRQCMNFEHFFFTIGGKILNESQLLVGLEKDQTINVLVKGNGGKGGFGAQLKMLAKNQKKATNFDASRNLNGQRIRDANNEKQLRKWYSEKLKQDEIVAEEKKEYAKFKKYQNVKQFRLTQEYKEKLDKWNSDMGDSIMQGIQKKVKKDVKSDSKKKSMKKKKGTVGFDLKGIFLNELAKQVPLKKGSKKDTIKANSENKTETISKKLESKIKQAAAQPEVKDTYERIDLDKISSLEDLKEIDPQRVKAELKLLGLKCGGSPIQRAERLYEIKKDPLNLFNPKFLAKKKKKKN